MKMRQYQ